MPDGDTNRHADALQFGLLEQGAGLRPLGSPCRWRRSSSTPKRSRGAVSRPGATGQFRGGLAAHGGKQGIGASSFDHLRAPRRG